MIRHHEVSMAFEKIQTPSRTELIVKDLMASITSGELKAGELLPNEKQLCEMFGVSRSILREAISQLASKDLVDVRQGYGTVVTKPRDEVALEAFSHYLTFNNITMLQIAELRSPLEIEIARIAALKARDSEIEQIAKQVEKLDAPGLKTEEYVYADDKFHFLLASATGNPVFGIIMRILIAHIHAGRAMTIGTFGTKVVYEQHKKIVEAVKRHDPEAAMSAMKDHMDLNGKHLRLIEEEEHEGRPA